MQPPHVFIGKMGVSELHYGGYIMIHCTSYIVGTVTVQKVAHLVRLRYLVAAGFTLQILSSLSLLYLYYFFHLTPLVIMLVWIPEGLVWACPWFVLQVCC